MFTVPKKLGKAFSDNVTVRGRREHSPVRSDMSAWWLGAGRILMFTMTMLAIFFVLFIRLADLTVVRGHQYRVLAEANRTRELVRHAPRGILRDRTGAPLVQNLPNYRLLKPCKKGDAAVLGCRQYLSPQEGDAMAAKGLPSGYFLETDFQRRYLSGPAIAHIVGYTSEISEGEIAREFYQLRGYKQGDRIGRMGAESVFEERLRGRDGKELVEVDAEGKILRMLGRDSEIPGSDVHLSIDLSLSDVVAATFPPNQSGAVIVSKPGTGEILALYSSPGFDPNSFTMGMTDAEFKELTSSIRLPMFNRAIAGVYPPGSTYKLVTALTGLEDGIITPQTVIEDTGRITVGKFSFANWYFTQYGRTEGSVNLVRAIARSNDIYFYKIGEKIGIDRLAQWSKRVGLGSVTGIELGGEAAGLMPDRAWKNERFSTPEDKIARNNLWYDGDTYHLAIGQGYLLTTPLQVNQWTNLVASGKLCTPTIEKTLQGVGHQAHCRDLNIQPEHLQVITEGMVKACDTGGTGWPFFGFGVHSSQFTEKQNASHSSELSTVNREPLTRIPVACKTGTAEYGDPKGKTHAWFTAFAPVPEQYVKNISPISGQTSLVSGDPEISVTVLVEEGGEGSSVAAPIVKKILEAWFGR